MWVGRGDYGKGEWKEAQDQARSIPAPDRARYLIGTPLLSDYLEQGLAELAFAEEQLER
jgi:hypothetical protein